MILSHFQISYINLIYKTLHNKYNSKTPRHSLNTHLEVNKFGNVGIGNVHLVQQATDKALNFTEVTEQTGFSFLRFFMWCAAGNDTLSIPEGHVWTGTFRLFLFSRQTNLQENLDSCTILQDDKKWM